MKREASVTATRWELDTPQHVVNWLMSVWREGCRANPPTTKAHRVEVTITARLVDDE